jgi:hypothetical protein
VAVAVDVVGIVGVEVVAAVSSPEVTADIADDEPEIDHIAGPAELLVVLVAVALVGNLGLVEEALVLGSRGPLFGHQVSWDSQDYQSRRIDGGSLGPVPVPVDVGASVLGLLGSYRSCPADSGHTADPEPVAANSVAHRICFVEAVDTAVATGTDVADEVGVGAVAHISRGVLEEWSAPAHMVSAASGEALGLDSMVLAKMTRPMCYALSVAILLEVAVLVGELAVRAHCTVAAAVWIAQAVLLRRHLVVLLRSRRA